MFKKCPRCGQTLPRSAFGSNRSLPDGLSFYCRACNRQRSNAWYRESRRSRGREVRDHSWVPDGFRWCPTCKRAVAHEDYSRNSRTASGFGGRCKSCHNAVNGEAYWLRRYGIPRSAVEEMRQAQGDACAICAEPAPEHLDHDHATGAVRQLLCQRCNHALGLFRDEPRFLRAAADYVERHRARQAASTGEGTAGARPGTPGRPGSPPVGSAPRRNGRSGTARRGGHTSRDSRQQAAGEADT
jgi:hypothetical protein